VANKRWILFLPLAAMIAVLAGCNSGSTLNVQNPPPPPPSNVTISVQTTGLTNGSVPVNGVVSLTATVQGTATQVGEGVAWYLTCQGGSGSICGTLSSPSSPSGAAITYMAPATLSSSSMVTEIVAYAQAQVTANNVSPITITTFDSSLKAGNYVLQVQGVQNGSTPYQFAGVITLDGQGNITAGEQTVNSNGASVTDTIAPVGSSYFMGSDGRGEITLNDPSAGIETFAFVFLNNSQNPQALLSQFDIQPAQTGASATGSMDLQQTGITAPSGSYAFVMNGTDVLDNDVPLAFGGVLDIPSGQTAISGVTDEIINETQKVSNAAFSAGSNISSGPDTFGQVTFSLIGLLSASHPKPITIVLTGYIVDASHIKLIESDTNANNLTPFGTTGGLAIGQAPGSYGNFTDASLPSGTTYVFGVTGVDLSANSADDGYLPSTLTSVGQFQADGNGNIVNNTGYTDTFLLYNLVQKNPQPGAQISSSFSGTYSVDPSGTGRTTLNNFTFNSSPTPTYRPELFFYLTGLTGTDPAALVLGVGDPGPQPNQHYPSLGSGIAYTQSTAAPAFSGDYGLSFTQQNGSENDGTAQMNANSTALTLTGFADSSFNIGFPSLPDQGFGGVFNSPSSVGPFAGTFENVNQSSAFTVGNNSNNEFAVDYYLIDADHGFFVETDLVNSIPPTTPPTSSAQVSFGYYAARTPVCTGCP
jgi:hypothetical protein